MSKLRQPAASGVRGHHGFAVRWRKHWDAQLNEAPTLHLNLKWVVAALTLVFVLLQLKLWSGEGSYMEVRHLRAAIEVQKIENSRLVERNAGLEAEVKDLKQGVEAIEERARSELGMIKRGETFFHVIDRAAAASDSSAQ